MHIQILSQYNYLMLLLCHGYKYHCHFTCPLGRTDCSV